MSIRETRPQGVASDDIRLTAWVHGAVQGVGFRWWVRTQALELNLRGAATNYPDGRVLVIAEGPRQEVKDLLTLLKEQPTTAQRPGMVLTVVDSLGPARGGYEGFERR